MEVKSINHFWMCVRQITSPRAEGILTAGNRKVWDYKKDLMGQFIPTENIS
jgi:hypothetical protein